MNLHLLRGITPPGERYAVRLPAGTASVFAENYATLEPSERLRSVIHIVWRGETSGRIARNYGVSLSSIREANEGVDLGRLTPGQRLVVPGARALKGLAG